MVAIGGRNGAQDVVIQVTTLHILYVVHNVTTKGVLYAQPVSNDGYSNVHPCHLGRCNVSTDLHIFYFCDLW